ncbi:hypothetical protein TNIN_166741 [Trichonephila inaurata madagascariensis]|uniref:Uncharacterized protein n=1 Tax=Trichonephila inaurata madagascariensis TaxID=2747483 RepID=A0A8X7BYY6_9ARAC|nr:hypothetical protein TNIN_166741 [Trichonephila inaurata madagascariensis]
MRYSRNTLLGRTLTSRILESNPIIVRHDEGHRKEVHTTASPGKCNPSTYTFLEISCRINPERCTPERLDNELPFFFNWLILHIQLSSPFGTMSCRIVVSRATHPSSREMLHSNIN